MKLPLSIIGLLFLGLIVVGNSWSHSPWSQYQAYRQKHLLILSTRDDLPSYAFSKRLVEAINSIEPTANARPARARNLKRAYDLLHSNQMQFAVLSKNNIENMRLATESFEGLERLELKTIYIYGDLEFVVLANFPSKLASIVTHAIIDTREQFEDAVSIENLKGLKTLHPGTKMVLDEL